MSTDGVSFRAAEVGDAPGLVALIQAAYRGEGGRVGWTSEAHLVQGRRIDQDQLIALLGEADSLVLVAEEGPALVGCCHLTRESAEAAYFGLFAVLPEQQGSGLGRRILAEVEAEASRWTCRRIGLQVISRRTELIGWYERLGYRSTGETVPFPVDDPDDRPIEAGLEFVRMTKSLAGER